MQNVNRKKSEIVNSLKGKEKIRVLFVCLGNICRSPAAEGIMRNVVEEGGEASRWEIDSAGMGGWHIGELPDSRMRVHARRRGYELDHRARQVKEADFDRYDLIVGMDSSNVAALERMAPTLEAKARVVPMAMWFDTISTRYDHVPDPYYEGAEGFELVLDLLEAALRSLFASVRVGG